MLVQLLGEVGIVGDDGRAVALRPQVRKVLAVLAVHRDHPVSVGRIADVLWDVGEPPRDAVGVIQTCISRLRKALIPGAVVRQPAGYALRLAPGQCDADRFTVAAQEHRWEEALRVWTGRPFADLGAEPFARKAVAHLDEVHAHVVERRLDDLITRGLADQAIVEGEWAIEEHTFHEGIRANRMRALVAVGRHVDAIREYHAYREVLVDETGLEPTARLAALERSILDGAEHLPGFVGAVEGAPVIAPDGALGAFSARERTWQGVLARETALVGRERALEVARDCLDLAASGSITVLVVDGPQGVGKSRFLREITASALGRDALVFHGICEQSGGEPFRPLEAVSRYLDRHRLDAGMEGGPAAPQTGDVGLLESVVAADPDVDIVANARRQERANALGGAVLAGAAARLVVLAIDDVQWADEGTVDVLEMLVGAFGSERASVLLVLGLRNPDPDGDGSARRRKIRLRRIESRVCSSVITLRGFADPEASHFFRLLTGSNPAPSLLASLLDASSGLPLQFVSIVRRLAATGELQQRGTVLGAARRSVFSSLDPLGFSLPPLIARPARDLLRRLALLGVSPSLSLVETVLGLRVEEVYAFADQFEQAGLLEVTGDRIRFSHDLIRQVVLTEMSGEVQESIARELLAAMNERSADREVRLAGASLLLRVDGVATDRERCRWFAGAAAICLEGALWADAARYFEAAVACAGVDAAARLELHLGAGLAYFHDYDASSVGHLQAAMASARAIGDIAAFGRAATLMHRVELTHGASRSADRDRALFDFLDLARGSLPSLRARAWRQLAESSWVKGELDEGADRAERAVEIAAEVGDPRLQSEVAFSEGLIRLGQLDLRRGTAAFQRSADFARFVDDSWVLGSSLARLAALEWLGGNAARCRATVARASALTRLDRNWSEVSVLEALLASVLAAEGRYDEAGETAEHAVVLADRSDYRFTYGLAYPVLVWLALRRHDLAAAGSVVQNWEGHGERASNGYRRIIDAMTSEKVPVRVNKAGDTVAGSGRVSLRLLGAIVPAAELAIFAGDVESAPSLRRAIESLLSHGVEFGLGWPTPLSMLSTRLGEIG